MVRAGGGSVAAADFQAKSVVAIGWYGADWTKFENSREIQAKLAALAPSKSSRQIIAAASQIERFIEKNYLDTGKHFRRCQPGDTISHAIDLIHFEQLPFELTDDVLDHLSYAWRRGLVQYARRRLDDCSQRVIQIQAASDGRASLHDLGELVLLCRSGHGWSRPYTTAGFPHDERERPPMARTLSRPTMGT